MNKEIELLEALKKIIQYPASVPGYNSSGAMLSRIVSMKQIARNAVANHEKDK